MSAEPRFPGEDGPDRRQHLRVVPSADDGAPQKSRRRRKALVPQAARANKRNGILTAFILIPVALLVILLLNILVASRQYDLVQMRADEKMLTQQNEAIAQEIEFYQAPQDLSIRASQLGLVASTFSASLDLQTGQISGTPIPASKPEEGGLDPAAIDPPALYDTEAFATASKRAAEERAKKEAEEKQKAEAEKKKAEAEDKEDASATASQSDSAEPSGEE